MQFLESLGFLPRVVRFQLLKMASLIRPTQSPLLLPPQFSSSHCSSSGNLALPKTRRRIESLVTGASRFSLSRTKTSNPAVEEFERSQEKRNVVEHKEVAKEETHHHPYAFHVSGPRNFSSPNWKDLISSSWKDDNYKRAAIACFVQAVYLLELDKQNTMLEPSLAPNWWKLFKYKPIQTLIDERDGSIFGALLEWDRLAAMSNFILMRPSGAPKVVLALRGTLVSSSTIRRDVEDDLRYVVWESLKGSVRFKTTLEALKSAVDRYGSENVCIAGHSLGAGFALQVGKMLAKEGVYVETHLFNPPSLSLAMSLRTIRDKLRFVWKRFKSMFPFIVQNNIQPQKEKPYRGTKMCVRSWVPHLYVNNSDYICCYYNEKAEPPIEDKNAYPSHRELAAKLFVMSKGNQKFTEAHGLEQWWSDDLELQLALYSSKLINRQLRCLYTVQKTAPTSEKVEEQQLKVDWTSWRFTSNIEKLIYCVVGSIPFLGVSTQTTITVT